MTGGGRDGCERGMGRRGRRWECATVLRSQKVIFKCQRHSTLVTYVRPVSMPIAMVFAPQEPCGLRIAARALAAPGHMMFTPRELIAQAARGPGSPWPRQAASLGPMASEASRGGEYVSDSLIFLRKSMHSGPAGGNNSHLELSQRYKGNVWTGTT